MEFVAFLGEEILVNSPIEATLMEIHNLAYFYHWGREECWNCPCHERGMWNDRLKQQMKAENGHSGNNSGNTPKSSYKESR